MDSLKIQDGFEPYYAGREMGLAARAPQKPQPDRSARDAGVGGRTHARRRANDDRPARRRH